MWKLHFLFIGPKSAKFQALLILQKEIYIFLFYVMIFPGNISQYVNGINAFGLDTDQARLIRLFFQPVLIACALWSTDGVAQIKEWISRYRSFKL